MSRDSHSTLDAEWRERVRAEEPWRPTITRAQAEEAHSRLTKDERRLCAVLPARELEIFLLLKIGLDARLEP